MWILFDGGFVSIVHKDCPPGSLLVRARVRKDLVAFITMGRPGPMPKIVRLPEADYRFRAVVPRPIVKRSLAAIADAVDYPNFKDRVHESQGIERARVYSNVWSDLYEGLAREG
jgi:hypothetical protein